MAKSPYAIRHSTPLCIDCENVSFRLTRYGDGTVYTCRRAGTGKTDPVDGVRYGLPLCVSERRNGWFRERCGPDGRFFVRKADPSPPTRGGSGKPPPSSDD